MSAQRTSLAWASGGASAGVIAGVMAFVAPFEGTVLRTHPDPIGITSACMGNRAAAVPGATFTMEECDLLLMADVIQHTVAVSKLVKVPIDENQTIALVSFSFNVGWQALAKSTLLRKLNAGDYEGAAAEFEKWRFAGGRELPGLVIRRAKEAKLFLAQP